MNFTLVLSMVIAVFGLFTGQQILFIAGMGVAAYTWFTRPRRYVIYTNALVVEYGQPRVKVVSFSQISHVELLSLPIGDRLRVVMLNGRRTMIMARDLDTFREKLDQAMESYQEAAASQEQQPQQENLVLDEAPGYSQDTPQDAGNSAGEPEGNGADYEGPPLR